MTKCALCFVTCRVRVNNLGRKRVVIVFGLSDVNTGPSAEKFRESVPTISAARAPCFGRGAFTDFDRCLPCDESLGVSAYHQGHEGKGRRWKPSVIINFGQLLKPCTRHSTAIVMSKPTITHLVSLSLPRTQLSCELSISWRHRSRSRVPTCS